MVRVMEILLSWLVSSWRIIHFTLKSNIYLNVPNLRQRFWILFSSYLNVLFFAFQQFEKKGTTNAANAKIQPKFYNIQFWARKTGIRIRFCKFVELRTIENVWKQIISTYVTSCRFHFTRSLTSLVDINAQTRTPRRNGQFNVLNDRVHKDSTFKIWKLGRRIP